MGGMRVKRVKGVKGDRLLYFFGLTSGMPTQPSMPTQAWAWHPVTPADYESTNMEYKKMKCVTALCVLLTLTPSALAAEEEVLPDLLDD